LHEKIFGASHYPIMSGCVCLCTERG
jgi:hypothetical protein